MQRLLYTFCMLTCLPFFGTAQDGDLLALLEDSTATPSREPVIATFKTTRLINAITNEQVKKGELDFRVAHRFDNIGGTAGGVETLFGFDNVTDIRISFDYGVKDWWCLGFSRSKGAYQQRQVLELSSKFKLWEQKKSHGSPLAVSAFLAGTYTPMKSATDSLSVTYFSKSAHRLTYTGQLILARKFSNNFSLLLLPTVVHRNLVRYDDANTTFAMGVGARVKFTKRLGLIFDYYYLLDELRKVGNTNGFYMPLGVGLEIETGGHVFHLLFSNNRGLLESQYLTANNNTWTQGEFRFGFNISRTFHLHN